MLPAQQFDLISKIKILRLHGELIEAQLLIMKEFPLNKSNPLMEIRLRLQLAEIFDRIGLHQNTRPVKESLTQIESASRVSVHNDSLLWGEIELVSARYYYRADMVNRKFMEAKIHVNNALEIFKEKNETDLQAEAVHLLGLIYMQQRTLEKANELFERSLELDRIENERPLFRGDYERHVGFVYYLSGDTLQALDYFRRSLEFRQKAGAIDHSLFAARTLASSLLQFNKFEEAKSILLYGLAIAELIDSPSGKARLGSVIGQLYEKTGDFEAAKIAYKMTNKIAKSINYTSMIQRTSEALDRLQSL